MEEIIEKYTDGVLKNLNKDNIIKICDFLDEENCNFIEDILEDYLDLFVFDYEEFIKKYNKLNEKYENNYLVMASENMDLLEEFYTI